MKDEVSAVHFSIVTIFPEIFRPFLEISLMGRAIKRGHIAVDLINPRDHAIGSHRSVDDKPYGGGPGMVLKVEPLVRAVEEISHDGPRILLCPQGKKIDQGDLLRLARLPHLALICGRYEGFDERIRHFVDEELSLGDIVISGGEIAAMAIIEGVGRLIPGVVGNPLSAAEESFSRGLLEYPHYTRPRVFRGLEVPFVLRSGNHEEISRWRMERMKSSTMRKRPDLWARYLRFAPVAGDEDVSIKPPRQDDG